MAILLVLMAGLLAVLLGCGPASAATEAPTDIEEATRARALQLTDISTTDPRTSAVYAAAQDTTNASSHHAISEADGPTPSDSELVALSRPRPDPSVAPLPRLKGQQDEIKADATDPAGVPNRKPSAQDRPYTWRDGDRTMTVLLQADSTVTGDGEIATQAYTASGSTRSDSVSKGASGSDGASDGMPVFRSQSGTLMTLPGGVLLALDKTWSKPETDAFFERNGIKPARVSELEYTANGYYVETEPGFPSLDLANSLAAQDGVRISTPNWRRELVAE